MGKIVEEAKFYADHYLPSTQQTGMATYFLAVFRTIESEIEQLKGQVELNLINMDTVNGHIRELVEQIEALENTIDHLCIEAKEKVFPDVPTDKFRKPPGGLEPGDVLEYHSPRYQKRIDAIFIGQTSEQRRSGWIEACRVCDGEVAVIDIELDECKFKFRPRFPDRKKR